MVSLPYGATELVLSGWTGRVDFNRAYGPVLYGQPYGSPGVFKRAVSQEIMRLLTKLWGANPEVSETHVTFRRSPDVVVRRENS